MGTRPAEVPAPTARQRPGRARRAPRPHLARGLLLLAAVVPLLLGAARPAAAWLPEGHMATGAMADDILQRHDPAALDAILRLMQSHPERAWFDQQLGGLAGPARARRMLELMAIWPDMARGGPFDHDSWHYSQAFASPLRHLVPFAFGGAEGAFRRNLATARDQSAAPADRALALCWVIHIVGDMHQPLHAAVWISWRFPVSDAGGNWAYVRRSATARPERLHFFWDSAGRPDGLSRASPDEFVAWLEWKHPYEAEPPIADPLAAFAGWIAHTRALARDVAYEDGALRPGKSPDTAPVLPPDYVERVRAVGAEQLAAAGNRIGALLTGLR